MSNNLEFDLIASLWKSESAPAVETPAVDPVKDLADWLATQTWSDFAQSLASFYASRGYLTEKQIASGEKMRAKVESKKAPAAKVDDGYEAKVNDVHVIDGTFYRVHQSQNGGWLYGAVWNGEKFVGPRFDSRAKGLMKRINKSTLATAAQAAEFGHVNERCVFCSHKIDTPESKAVGYGEICANQRGLPWG